MAEISQAEKLDIFRAFMEQVVADTRAGQHHPPGCVQPPVGVHPSNALVYFSPALQEFFSEISRDDLIKLSVVLKINHEVLTWLSEKSEKEIDRLEWIANKSESDLKKFDKAADFFSTSNTAVKVIALVVGTCVTVLGGLFVLARNGIDFLASFKGMK